MSFELHGRTHFNSREVAALRSHSPGISQLPRSGAAAWEGGRRLDSCLLAPCAGPWCFSLQVRCMPTWCDRRVWRRCGLRGALVVRGGRCQWRGGRPPALWPDLCPCSHSVCCCLPAADYSPSFNSQQRMLGGPLDPSLRAMSSSAAAAAAAAGRQAFAGGSSRDLGDWLTRGGISLGQYGQGSAKSLEQLWWVCIAAMLEGWRAAGGKQRSHCKLAHSALAGWLADWLQGGGGGRRDTAVLRGRQATARGGSSQRVFEEQQGADTVRGGTGARLGG